jgi:hypothetical protein
MSIYLPPMAVSPNVPDDDAGRKFLRAGLVPEWSMAGRLLAETRSDNTKIKRLKTVG